MDVATLVLEHALEHGEGVAEVVGGGKRDLQDLDARESLLGGGLLRVDRGRGIDHVDLLDEFALVVEDQGDIVVALGEVGGLVAEGEEAFVVCGELVVAGSGEAESEAAGTVGEGGGEAAGGYAGAGDGYSVLVYYSATD
jgi:hypothetical protein